MKKKIHVAPEGFQPGRANTSILPKWYIQDTPTKEGKEQAKPQANAKKRGDGEAQGKSSKKIHHRRKSRMSQKQATKKPTDKPTGIGRAGRETTMKKMRARSRNKKINASSSSTQRKMEETRRGPVPSEKDQNPEKKRKQNYAE